jgi:hypothetical protein
MDARRIPCEDQVMEHRWGQRLSVEIPVRVSAHPFSLRHGRLRNLSVSGAFIELAADLRPLSRIQVALDHSHHARHDAPTVAAYVARKYKDGVGVEWCEFAPPAVALLLRSFTLRPHVRVRKPEAPAAIAISRLHAPLLKHGS